MVLVEQKSFERVGSHIVPPFQRIDQSVRSIVHSAKELLSAEARQDVFSMLRFEADQRTQTLQDKCREDANRLYQRDQRLNATFHPLQLDANAQIAALQEATMVPTHILDMRRASASE